MATEISEEIPANGGWAKELPPNLKIKYLRKITVNIKIATCKKTFFLNKIFNK